RVTRSSTSTTAGCTRRRNAPRTSSRSSSAPGDCSLRCELSARSGWRLRSLARVNLGGRRRGRRLGQLEVPVTRRGGLNRALRTALGCACVAAMLVGCAGPGERAATAPNAPLEPGTGTVQRDRTFVVRDSGPLSMDLYSPTDGRMPRPLVVYVHGGGWDA